MKRNFFLAAGLLFTAFGLAQTQTTLNMQGNTTNILENVFLGEGAGTSNSSGQENVFIGYNAGASNQTGEASVAIGNEAGFSYNPSLPNDGASVFIGNGAGRNTTTGFNVFMGYRAGFNNNLSSNVFIGTTAGMNCMTSANSFLGHGAGESASGNSNVSIGNWAGRYSDGNNNVFIGNDAGAGISNTIQAGGNNVILGYRAGRYSDGNNNVLLGYKAGHDIEGSGNILIGYNSGLNLSNANDLLYIENSDNENPLIYGEFDNNVLKFNAEKVGIGYEGTGDPGFGDFPNTSSWEDTDLSYRFFVRGGILAEEVRVRVHDDWIWADYVFAEDYKLQPLSEVEAFIKNNGHLPNMPSAEEVQKEGLAVSEIIKLQQEKIEELTLHLIEQEKEMKVLKEQVQQLLNKE